MSFVVSFAISVIILVGKNYKCYSKNEKALCRRTKEKYYLFIFLFSYLFVINVINIKRSCKLKKNIFRPCSFCRRNFYQLLQISGHADFTIKCSHFIAWSRLRFFRGTSSSARSTAKVTQEMSVDPADERHAPPWFQLCPFIKKLQKIQFANPASCYQRLSGRMQLLYDSDGLRQTLSLQRTWSCARWNQPPINRLSAITVTFQYVIKLSFRIYR